MPHPSPSCRKNKEGGEKTYEQRQEGKEMHNIHRGEKSDVGIRQEDTVRGEIIAGKEKKVQEKMTERAYETGTPGEKDVER